MKHILEFARFKDKKVFVSEYDVYFNDFEIVIKLNFDEYNGSSFGDDVYIEFDIKNYIVSIDDYAKVYGYDTQLLNYITNNDELLDKVETLIFKHAPDTSIEEFKELLKNPKSKMYEE